MEDTGSVDRGAFEWIIGSDNGVIHEKLIDVGGYSEVHQVRQFPYARLNLDATN
jgi:hypothetical protein